MVTVKAQDADRYIGNPPDRVRMFLIYGSDAGAVTERGRAALNMAVSRGPDGGNIIRLGAEDLSQDPGRLSDEALSVSMFGGEPVIHIRISDGRHNLMPALQPLLDAPPEAAWIVIEAGDLRKSNPVRKAFEASSGAASVICYEPDEREIAGLVKTMVSEAGKAIDADAADMLIGMLGSDRLATRTEIDKLILYVGEETVIDIDHVTSSAGETLALRSDRIIDAALLGRMADLDMDLVRLRNEGQSASGLATLMLRHLLTMQGMRARFDKGSSARQTVDSARPPVFFRRRAAFQEALGLWPADYLRRARMIVGDAISLSRKTPQLELDLVSDALHRIALMARRLARAA